MSVKSNLYFGPRAIFDPNFIPPELLYRKKEENSLLSILNDSISDNFCLNILYQGIQGIGKKVIVKKVLNEVLIQNKDFLNIHEISVDCKEKNLEELIISLLAEINKLINLNLNINTILNSTISHLWSIFKLACKKFNGTLIFIFNNIESLKPGVFDKFLSFAKETNISIISTINRVLRASAIDILSKFDLKKKLNIFTYKELNSILRQRASLTFSYEIDKDLINFITDLTFEHYAPVPGKGIDVFREIYPHIKDRGEIDQYEMLEICQNQFDSFRISDEFAMLTYISEEDLLTAIFLDNLSNHFLKKTKYYIIIKELRELYDLSCEALEYKKSNDEFNELIQMTNNIGILNSSRKDYSTGKNIKFKNNILECNSFFMIISPHQLKSMVDVLFGKL